MATTDDRLTREANATINKGAKVLTPPPRSRPTTPAEQEADTVQVWPHLIVIEFLATVIFSINLVLLGTLVNGPLEDLANPDRTPNPSKAPWYFLNLQELLLHMNPALAGVIIPTIALGLIAIIPYVDRGTRGLGIWFYSPRGSKIALFSAIYTTVVCAALIALDTLTGTVKSVVTNALQTEVTSPGHGGILAGVTELTGNLLGGAATDSQPQALGMLVEAFAGWIIPSIFFIIFTVLLVVLIKRVFKGADLTEIIIALFTGFVTVFAVLTFVGTAMRGPGMALFPPWAVPPATKGG